MAEFQPVRIAPFEQWCPRDHIYTPQEMEMVARAVGKIVRVQPLGDDNITDCGCPAYLVDVGELERANKSLYDEVEWMHNRLVDFERLVELLRELLGVQ